MNLFDQITGKSSMQGFLGNKQPETPSFAQPVAPRTSSYTQPTPKKKMSYEMPGYKESVNTRANAPTEGLFYKGVQGVADMFTGAKEGLKGTEASDKAVFEQEINAKKQKFTQDKLKEGFTTKQIDGALKLLEDRGEFTYKPGFGTRLATNLGSRMQEMENTTERLSNQVGTPNRTIAEGAVSYIGDVVGGIPGDVIGATIEPVVSPVIQKVVEKVGVENVKAVSDWYSKTKQENPAIIDALEGVFNIAGAIAPFTKTGQQVIKAPANVAKDVVVGATELPGKTVNKVKSFFPTPEQKLVKSLGQETAPGVVAGKVVQVPVPEKGIIEKITGGALRPKDPKVLAGRALAPRIAGKTDKQKLSAIGDVEKNIKQFYDGVRTGLYEGDLSTLESAANSVIQNIDKVGERIGNAISETSGKIPLSKNRATIKKVLSDPIEKRGGAWKILNNFYKDTAPIDGLSIQRAFKAKKIYQAEIKKLIKSGDTGTDAYEALVKGVQELNDNIDNAVANTPGFKADKAQYAHLKKIVTDIANSAVVEGRRSPQTFVEQLGMVETLMDAVSNPLSTAGKLFAKEIGELNTRGGAWKELIKIYDTEAIGNVGKTPITKSVPKARKIKDPTKTTVNLQQSKGGFIKIPEIGKKSILDEFNNFKGYSDGIKGKSEVMSAIEDIGGIENVKRTTLKITDIKPTESYNTANEGVKRVMEEIKAGNKIPVIVDEIGEIIDGNHRYSAYKALGITDIPVISPKNIVTPKKIEAKVPTGKNIEIVQIPNKGGYKIQDENGYVYGTVRTKQGAEDFKAKTIEKKSIPVKNPPKR